MDIEKVIERNFTRITEEYRAFALEKDKCQKCSIYKNYSQVVQSEGNAKNPTFMFIGEAAGKDEVEQVRPFVGAAGRVLRTEMRKYPKAFKRTNTIITNVLACRPLDNKFPAGDKSPEVSVCTNNWLFKEIKILRPKIIVTLGNPALKYVCGDWGITANRGKWKFLHRFRVWSFATYHPSYVMRSERSEKQFVVEQFQNDIRAVATMWH
ncbi:hypothetical protein LCGC14_2828170, partial [marine sediment metagenome]